MPTLGSVPVGSGCAVVDVAADPRLRRRLAELGVRRGATVRVVQRTSGGGRTVAVAGARIALDRSVLDAVTVEPTDAVPEVAS